MNDWCCPEHDAEQEPLIPQPVLLAPPVGVPPAPTLPAAATLPDITVPAPDMPSDAGIHPVPPLTPALLTPPVESSDVLGLPAVPPQLIMLDATATTTTS